MCAAFLEIFKMMSNYVLGRSAFRTFIKVVEFGHEVDREGDVPSDLNYMSRSEFVLKDRVFYK